MKQKTKSIVDVQFDLSQYDDFNSPTFKHLFDSFTEQLSKFRTKDVILSDPYFLSIDESKIESLEEDWIQKLGADDKSKLILLSILCLPADFSNLSNLRFESILPSDFTCPLTKVSVIESLSSEFWGSFSTWQDYWQIAEWSEEWAIVYNLTEAISDSGFLVPSVLGFCRKDDLELNFINLLRSGTALFDQGFYCTYGEATGSWRMGEFALHILPDDELPDWEVIENLQSLDDQVLAKILKDNAKVSHTDFLTHIRSILNAADDNGLHSLSLNELIEKAGGKPSLTSIDAQMPKWEKEHDDRVERDRELKEKENKEKEEKLQFARKRIDAWAHAICGEKPSGQWAGFGWSTRFRHVQTFIENHVLTENSFPSGKHDLGSVKIMNSESSIGVIDFDEVSASGRDIKC